MESLYKIGDSVLVKSKYDNGCDDSNYRFVFVEDMLSTFGGKVCTIKGVIIRDMNVDEELISDDGYCYFLDADNGLYSWASSMFEPEF